MLLFDDSNHPWKYENQNNNIIYFKGDIATARNAFECAQDNASKNVIERLSGVFQKCMHFTSGAIENEKYIIAWTDHIRSWPIFYTPQQDSIIIANNARKLQERIGLHNVSKPHLTEFAMSGFVSGKYTIMKDLFCLQPGEFLLFDKTQSSLITKRYFQYTPDYSSSLSQEAKKQKLGQILDESIQEIINKAKDRTIWVPLSAGLDSRLLLCKLHEHGCKNLQTFTYGPDYNFEAIHAKKIAQILGVPWRMINLPNGKLKNYFDSSERQKFWQYADNLKTIPCMREFSAIYYLYEQNIAQPGDVFLNGQSGDYITGGHIFLNWFDDATVTSKHFFNAIIQKHYGLWAFLNTESNIPVIQDSIEASLAEDLNNKSSFIERAAQLESWEYDARQICYVVNGQRAYEFFGFEWEMPLWDKRLVQYCQTLTLQDKKNQSLFKAYLRNYNYKGLFPAKEPHIWRWPLPMLWVVAAAKFIGWIAGKKSKDHFYAAMRCHGHYANQYNFFPKGLHSLNYKNARNEVALYVALWLKENNFDKQIPLFENVKYPNDS